MSVNEWCELWAPGQLAFDLGSRCWGTRGWPGPTERAGRFVSLGAPSGLGHHAPLGTGCGGEMPTGTLALTTGKLPNLSVFQLLILKVMMIILAFSSKSRGEDKSAKP